MLEFENDVINVVMRRSLSGGPDIVILRFFNDFVDTSSAWFWGKSSDLSIEVAVNSRALLSSVLYLHGAVSVESVESWELVL